MICPVCGHDNLQGEDNCENCGADLRSADIPQPSAGFETRLVEARLGRLDAAPPVSMSADANVMQAIHALQDGSTECVLVEEGGRLVGVFTERDALLKLAARPLDGVKLDDVMTRDPVVLRADDSMAVAIHKMALGGFRHIPLVEASKPTGVISARDIFRHILGILDRPVS